MCLAARREPQTARKPAGGFIDCPVECLTLPWWVYQQGAMGLGTLRVWFGTLELVEKRCGAAPGTPVHYSAEELRRLLRVPRLAPVTAAVQQLETLGLLAWSPQAHWRCCRTRQVVQEALAQDGYQTLRAQCAPGVRWVPVPRRLLVWLAQEGQAGLIATALGRAAALHALQGPAVCGRGAGGGAVDCDGLWGGRAHGAAGHADAAALWVAGAAGGAAGARAAAWALYGDQSGLAATGGHGQDTAASATPPHRRRSPLLRRVKRCHPSRGPRVKRCHPWQRKRCR